MAPYASIRCRSEGSSRSTTGYCTSITATLPSGDSAGAPALTTCGSAAAPARTADRAAAASGEASVAPGSFGVSTSCMVSPARADAVVVSSSVAWLGVRAGHREGVLELLPDGAAGREHDHHQQQPGADDLPRVARGQSAPAIESVRQHGDSLEDPRYAGRSPTCPSSRAAGGGDIGPGARADPADRPAARSSFRPMSQRPGFTRLGG